MTQPGLDDAREALRWHEERFRLLVDSVRDYAIFMLDPEGRVISWNTGAERIKQYKAEEILGQHFSKFYPPEEIKDGRCAKCDLELEVAAREGRFEDEGWRVRKDGTRFWASVILTPLRDHAGKLLGYAKVTRDLTEKRKAEEERLRLMEERTARASAEEAQRFLSTVLQSIGDAVIATDREGRVTVMNAVAASLCGYTLDEARGKPLRDVFRIINEETRREVESPVDRVLREGGVVGLANHTMLVRADGTETPIADSGAPIRDAEGKIHGVVLVFRDASDEKLELERHRFMALATAALSSSLDYKQTLARVAELAVPKLADWCAVEIIEEGSPNPVQVAVAHVDPNRVAFVHELAARYPPNPNASTGAPHVIRTGRTELFEEIPESMLAQAAVSPDHLKLLKELSLHSAVVVPLTTGVRVLGALTLVFAESRRHYDQGDVAFVEEIGRRAGMAIENARLYAAEQRAREAADSANRTKDEFLATVSHELRTPLSAILGWAKIMVAGGLDDEKRTRAIETIERNAVSMAQLIEDLLDVSRIVSGKMRIDVKSVDLVPVVEAALDSIQPAALAKGIRIERDLEQTTEPVLGDAARLQQVVWNLVNNAVKFTPRGGTVRVALGGEDHSSAIIVTDTGKGIEPRFLPFVFEHFRQGDGGISRSTGGLGLGLGISKHLVELHGGSIQAASDGPGKGATFTVHIPTAAVSRAGAAEVSLRSSTPARSPASSLGVEPLPQLKGLDVLVVDDEPDARMLVSAVLEQCGSRVRTAASVDEALAAIRERVPDVLVSDIGMPVQSGYDLIRKVRALPQNAGGAIPAAALTAYARAEDRGKALSAGFMMHVPKPIDPAELVTVVAELAASRPSSRP